MPVAASGIAIRSRLGWTPSRTLAQEQATLVTWLVEARITKVTNSISGKVLSRHRTTQAAIDTWRTQFSGVPVQKWRRRSHTVTR
jgi:hypothetical protein